MPRTSRPVTVTLGDLKERVDARVKSGAYASVSEVMRAAIRALDREDAAMTEWLRDRVNDAFADPRPNIPAGDVFKRFREQNLAEYERLDKEFEGLTESETRLGAFWFSKG